MLYRKIDPALLIPNRHRNFKINPIDSNQVLALATSYENNEDMGVLTVRPVASGKYELVFGHHRLEAQRRLGWSEVDCKVGDLTDMQMLSGMIAENATQYGGRPESQMDSIQAMIKTVAYALRICDGNEDCSQILEQSLYPSENMFTKAKTNLLKDGEIGEPVITKMTGIMKHNVTARIAEMRATGAMAEILQGVEKRVSVEMKAEAVESKRIEAEAKKTEAARIKAEKAEAKELKRIKAEQAELAKQAEVAQKTADKKRIADQQAQAKREVDEAERRQKLRAKETARLQTEREEREARDTKLKAEQAQAREAAAKVEEDSFLERDALELFTVTSQRSAFRQGVSNNLDSFTAPGTQLDFAQKIVERLGDPDEEYGMSVSGIEWMFGQLESDRNKKIQAADDRRRKEAAKESAQNKAGYVIDEMRIASSRFGSAMGQLAKAIEDAEVRRWVTNKVGGPNGDRDLIKALDYAEASIHRMRDQLNIGTMKKETVIDHSVVARQ